MKISEIIQKAGLNSEEKEIRMGIVNGWNSDRIKLSRDLKKFIIEGSGKERSLGRCYTEYSYEVTDGIDTYLVTYTVDSSD